MILLVFFLFYQFVAYIIHLHLYSFDFEKKKLKL